MAAERDHPNGAETPGVVGIFVACQAAYLFLSTRPKIENRKSGEMRGNDEREGLCCFIYIMSTLFVLPSLLTTQIRMLSYVSVGKLFQDQYLTILRFEFFK